LSVCDLNNIPIGHNYFYISQLINSSTFTTFIDLNSTYSAPLLRGLRYVVHSSKNISRFLWYNPNYKVNPIIKQCVEMVLNPKLNPDTFPAEVIQTMLGLLADIMETSGVALIEDINSLGLWDPKDFPHRFRDFLKKFVIPIVQRLGPQSINSTECEVNFHWLMEIVVSAFESEQLWNLAFTAFKVLLAWGHQYNEIHWPFVASFVYKRLVNPVQNATNVIALLEIFLELVEFIVKSKTTLTPYIVSMLDQKYLSNLESLSSTTKKIVRNIQKELKNNSPPPTPEEMLAGIELKVEISDWTSIL